MDFRESFSIILPVYKKDNYKLLSKSLRSLFISNIMPTTIIIVIDGPIPRNLEIVIAKYSSKYPEIINIQKLESNVGLAKALNFALKFVTTKWVLRLDADDFNHKDRFEITESYIKKNPEVVLFGGTIISKI